MEQPSGAQCVLYRPDGTTEYFAAIEPAIAAWRSSAGRGLVWVDVQRPAAAQMALLHSTFDLHPLAVEDTLEGGQRSKFERYDGSNFLVLRPASIVGAHTIELAEIEIFVGEGFLITAHRDGVAGGSEDGARPHSVGGTPALPARTAVLTDAQDAGARRRGSSPADPPARDPEEVRAEREARRTGRRGYRWQADDAFRQIHESFSSSAARRWLGAEHRPAPEEQDVHTDAHSDTRRDPRGADSRSSDSRSLAAAYALLHRIIDRVVDLYAPILDDLENEADDLEEQIFSGEPVSSHDIYGLSRGILDLDRVIKPLPTLMQGLSSFAVDSRLTNELLRNLRDVADHVHSIGDRLERLRSILHEIFNVNSTLVAERQGEQTKKISAWAGVFFFPSLVAGVYGMNFTHMPELGWFWGYPFSLVLMALGCVIIYTVFKRKDWI